MSFYLTQNPSRFARQNEAATLAQHVQFLRSGFQQPFSNAPQTDIVADNHTYTVDELLNRYLVRTSLSDLFPLDTLPTAAQIISKIKKQQDVRRLAQDNTNIAPSKGFFWDVCFSVPTGNESIAELIIRSPNDVEELDPAIDGTLTISNCASAYPSHQIYVQGGFDGGISTHIWVRFTLVNLTEGSLEVNASVLTNNCYLYD